MNKIQQLQNESENLKLLAAQRVLYTRAKKAFGIQVLVTVFLSVFLNFVKLIPKNFIGFDYTGFVGLISLIICFGDLLFFNIYISGLRTNAAKIQELFDCNLFGLQWNATNSGAKPEKHIIAENSTRFIPDPKAPLENWYDIKLDGLSTERAILVCQEANLFYDGKLRDHFKYANIFCCVSIFIVSMISALIADIKVSSYFTFVLIPVLPIIVITLKTIMENKKSLTASIELKKTVQQLLSKAGEPSMHELRQVQDKIFCSRKDSSLVPEWYYKWRRSKLEKAMRDNAAR